MAGAFIEALCRPIKRMAVDRLHAVGDIYDRGHARPHSGYARSITGWISSSGANHDIVRWRGGGQCGPRVAMMLNSALQYNTLAIVGKITYGISLSDLIGFAQETHKGCMWFMPRLEDDAYYVKNRMDTLSKAHKAIAIIMLKLRTSSAGTRSMAWRSIGFS